MPWRSPSASRSSTRGALRAAGPLLAAVVAAAAAAVALERRRHLRAEERLARETREREAERAWLSSQVIGAEREERRRLSLALHDGPVQSLSGIALMHDAALKALRAGRIDEGVAILESALARERDTVQALRDLSFALEPVVLRDQGLAAALGALADQLGAARSVDVRVEIEEADALGEKAQVALYQTVREALDQAVRRRPSRIEVSIQAEADGGIVASVADDGVPERRRATAEAIEERVRVLGGRVAVEHGDGRGTTVRITLPAYVASV